jgi:hypothetical protein
MSLKIDMAPPVPSFTVTMFGIVTPGDQLRLEAVGCVAPVGKIVKKLDEVVSVAVAFITTAEAWVGTPFLPPTTRSTVCPDWSGPVIPPVPLRVSRILVGVIGLNPMRAHVPGVPAARQVKKLESEST